MSFFEFPNTRTYDNDLGWLIRHMIEMSEEISDFIVMNQIKYANPISWNITTQYEKNTIVVNPEDGIAYISSQPVPAGVPITNTDYWTQIFNGNNVFKVWVTPEMYGAAADGATDDTAAIMAAINSGYPVVFNEKEYLIENSIRLDTEERIRFVLDASRARITYTGNGYAVRVSKMRYSDLRFGTINAYTGGGIEIYAGAEANDRVQYINIYFEQIAASTSGYSGIYGHADDNDGSWVNEIRIRNGHLIRGENGINIVNSGRYKMDRWEFDAVGFEGTSCGIRVEAAAKDIGEFLFMGCRLQESIDTFIHSIGKVRGFMFLMPTTYTISFNLQDKVILESNATGSADYWKFLDTKEGTFYVREGVIWYDAIPMALGNGHRLLPGDDLNDILTIGNYFCISNSDAAQVAHSPTGAAYALTVRYSNGAPVPGDIRYIQEVVNTSGLKYERIVTNIGGVMTYGDWVIQLTNEYVETYDSVVEGITLAAYGGRGPKAIKITGNPTEEHASGVEFTLGVISDSRLLPKREVTTDVLATSAGERLFITLSTNGTVKVVPRMTIGPNTNVLNAYLPYL